MEILDSYIQYYKVMDSWTKTARFYSDIAWYTYSVFGVIPLFYIALWRYLN